MVTSVVLDLVEQIGAKSIGSTVEVLLRPGDADTVAAWCERTGNELMSATDGRAVVRRGRRPAPTDALAELPAGQRPGARLWIYTNFDCNLACDYCCARSSPTAPRRAIGVDRTRQLIAEAADAGVLEVFLTGGEPFLLPDLDLLVGACVAKLPTTMLTNGMLFRGTRLAMLRRMPREGLTLQISLDSATPELHDRHRGAGTWQRAVDGIGIAQAEGFCIRVAATVTRDEVDAGAQSAFHAMLDAMGVARENQIVRQVAQRGFATDGLALTVETLLPEVTVTADGIFWHPVGADHLDQLVTRALFPLRAAIDEVTRRFADYRRTVTTGAEAFPCA
ncbi:MAG: radical SAM protein [Actinomycetota bacterium]